MNKLEKISNQFAVAYKELNELKDNDLIGIYVATQEVIQNHHRSLGFVEYLNRLKSDCNIFEEIEKYKTRYFEIDKIKDEELKHEKEMDFYYDCCKFTGKYYCNCLICLIRNWDVYEEIKELLKEKK